MLTRMRRLHDELHENASPGANTDHPLPETGGVAPTSSPIGRKHSIRNGMKEENVTPFYLCLLAKPEEEVRSALRAVSSARRSLEGVAEGRGHHARWCRWISSVLSGEASPSDPSVKSCASRPSDAPRVSAVMEGKAGASFPSAVADDGARRHDVRFPHDVAVSSRISTASPTAAFEAETDAEASGGFPRDRVEDMQRRLEDRVRSFPPPRPLSNLGVMALAEADGDEVERTTSSSTRGAASAVRCDTFWTKF